MIEITPPEEAGAPTMVSATADVMSHPGGGPMDKFCASDYVHGVLHTKVPSDSLGSDNWRMFGPGGRRGTNSRAPK